MNATTRRTFLKTAPVAAAAAAMAVPAEAEAPDNLSTANLDALIEHHRAALAGFHAAIDRENEAEHDYKQKYGFGASEKLMPLSNGESVTLYFGSGSSPDDKATADCRERVRQRYEHTFRQLKRLHPEALAEIRKARAADMRAVTKAVKVEFQRREQHGYAKAARDQRAASHAEHVAACAILAHRCSTPAEHDKRLRYLTDDKVGRVIYENLHDGGPHPDELLDALLLGKMPALVTRKEHLS